MTKSAGTVRGLETKVKGLDRLRITLVTKSCSNEGDLNWLLLAKAAQGGLKQERVVFEKEKKIFPVKQKSSVCYIQSKKKYPEFSGSSTPCPTVTIFNICLILLSSQEVENISTLTNHNFLK